MDVASGELREEHHLEGQRRSLAMLRPQSLVWTREQAIAAIEEIQRLRKGMRELLAQRHAGPGSGVAGPS
jgi:hypothetical protein